MTVFWVLNDEDDADGGTVPESKRIAEVRWLSRQGFTAPSGSSFYLWDFKLFSTYTFHLSSLWVVLVWTIIAEKVLGLSIGDDTGNEDSGFFSDDVSVGTNIDDNESVFSMDDDIRDSGCSVDAETEWRVPRIKDCP